MSIFEYIFFYDGMGFEYHKKSYDWILEDWDILIYFEIQLGIELS